MSTKKNYKIDALLIHCLYGGAAPSGEDITVYKELSLMNDILGVKNVKSLLIDFDRSVWKPLQVLYFFLTLIKTNFLLVFYVFTLRPARVIVHNSFPFFSLILVNFLGRFVHIDFYMHNHRIYCSNALLLRDGVYCDLCIRSRSNFGGLKYRCKNGSFFKSLFYSLHGSLIRFFGLKNIRRFITFSNKHKEIVVSSSVSSEERVLVLPHFVDNKAVDYLCGSSLPKISATSRPNFLFAGRLSAEKGVEQLLEAISKYDTLNITLVGDGPLKKKLELKYKQYENIVFLGKLSQPELFKEIYKSSYLVFNSKCFETFGLVIAEAFSLGKPVICRNLGSPSDYVQHGVNGFLFSDANLSQTLLDACEVDDDFYFSLAQSAKDTYLKFFTADNRINFYKSQVKE